MLYVNYKKGQQEQIIYLASSVQSIISSNILYVFTDGHAIMTLSNFYCREEDLNHIDWNIMKQRYWHDTPEDPDKKRRRQAEFLVHRFMPWTLIEKIVVYDQNFRTLAERYIEKNLHRPIIKIEPGWYY